MTIDIFGTKDKERRLAYHIYTKSQYPEVFNLNSKLNSFEGSETSVSSNTYIGVQALSYC